MLTKMIVLAALCIALLPAVHLGDGEANGVAWAVDNSYSIDPCAACAYVPLWCWRCMFDNYWDSGCMPGDPACDLYW